MNAGRKSKLKLPNLKVIDIFAGCGGLSLGFENAGYEVVAAYDNWEAAIKVYRQNFSHKIFNLDLAKVTSFNIFLEEKPDIIIGGPPCQDFSSAGKRNEELGRADLTIGFAKIIAAVKPKWFVMENVQGILKSDKYRVAREILKEVGYGLNEKKLDASLCSVPQKRIRFFCIGQLYGKDERLIPYLERNLSDKPMTIRDYLGDFLGIDYYYRHPRSYKRRGIFSIDEPSPTIRGVNRPIPKNYKPHPGNSVAVSSDLRPLTTIERSYIQTFPKSFSFEGSKTDIEQMIGNAVPVKLAEYVAKCLSEYILEDSGCIF